MTEELETKLRVALAAKAATIPPSAARRVRSAQYRPRARRLRPPVAAGAVLAAGAAGAAVVSLVGLGAGTTPAFAGWSASPTSAAKGQVTGAEAACQQRINALTSPHMPASTGLSAVLTDTRGPFTFVIFASANASASCISGPSFTSVSRTESSANGSHQGGLLSVSGASAGSGSASGSVSGPPQPPRTTVSGNTTATTTGPAAGHITISTLHAQAGSGQPYSFAEGRTGTGVTGATLVLDDGTKVQASTANGWYVAWWPGSANVTDAVVSAASGSVTQAAAGPIAP